MKTPTDIWVVTRSNGIPYAYVRSADWMGAQERANKHPVITLQAKQDGGYAIRRMRKGEVIEMLNNRVHIPDLPENFCTQGLYAYLNNNIDPEPEKAIADLRREGYLPAPYIRTDNDVYACPTWNMNNVAEWAIELLNENAQNGNERRTLRFFTKSEITEITEGIQWNAPAIL